LLQQAIRAP